MTTNNFRTFFGFAVADSMFPVESCTITRCVLSVGVTVATLALAENVISALNPSHKATIDALRTRYPNVAQYITIPESAPKVNLAKGDSLIVMSVRGLPRLDATRHEYTKEEIESATFVFSRYCVLL